MSSNNFIRTTYFYKVTKSSDRTKRKSGKKTKLIDSTNEACPVPHLTRDIRDTTAAGPPLPPPSPPSRKTPAPAPQSAPQPHRQPRGRCTSGFPGRCSRGEILRYAQDDREMPGAAAAPAPTCWTRIRPSRLTAISAAVRALPKCCSKARRRASLPSLPCHRPGRKATRKASAPAQEKPWTWHGKTAK